MRLYEIQTIKPIKSTKPLTPQQARLANLKRNADSANKAYKTEKNKLKVVSAQQQIFKATHAKKQVAVFSVAQDLGLLVF